VDGSCKNIERDAASDARVVKEGFELGAVAVAPGRRIEFRGKTD
jgi:hypothetical protein